MSTDKIRLDARQWDTFFGIMFPQKPEIWATHIGPTGALKAAVLAGETRPLPPYLSEEDKTEMSKALLSGGLTGPTCYYKVSVSGLTQEDELSKYYLSRFRFFTSHL